MSSQGFPGGGGGGTEDKPRPSLPQGHILQSAALTTNMPAMVKSNRLIAPAPTISSQLVGAPPVSGNIITGMVLGNTVGRDHQGAGQASVVLPISTTPPAASIQGLTTPVSIQAANSLIQAPSQPTHQTAFRPARTTSPVLLTMPVPMSSLIRAQTPAGGMQPVATSSAISQLGQPTTAVVTTTVPASHVPRGAAAASALATPKSTAMAQVLRSHTPQILTTTVTLTPTPLLSGIQTRGHLPLRAAAPAGHPGRSNSPSSATIAHDSTHRPTIQQQTVITGPTSGPVQIIQQKAEPAGRQLTTSLQPSLQAAIVNKQVQLTQGPTNLSLPQKVVVSQTPAQVTHPQKIGGYMSAGVSRPQRMVFSQPAGTGHPTNSSKTGTTVNKTPKMMMAQQSPLGSTVGSTVSGVVQQAMVATGLNLPLASRPQKVVGTTLATPITALAKTVAPIQSPNTPHTTVTMATSTTTVSAIPIAKVPPQRQIVHSPGQQVSQVTPVVGQQLIHDLSVSVATPQTSQTPAVAPTGVILQRRASPVTVATASGITAAVTLASSDTRQENRTNIATFPFANYLQTQGQTILNYPAVNYQQVAYQPVAAQNLPFQNAAPLRSSIVPGSAPNLALHTVATTQAVRVNQPLMVAVDTSRTHPQQFTLQADNKATSAPSPDTAVTTSATAFTNAMSQSGLASTVAPQPAVLVNNQSASPRPSILRKRTSEGVAARKNLLTTGSLDSTSPSDQNSLITTPTKINIHDPTRENSQSSTDTASSSESGPHSVTTPELKIKEEPPDNVENGEGPNHLAIPSSPALSTEASPRKKPRKQLLNAAEELKDGMSSDEDEKISAKHNITKVIENMTSRIKKEEEEEEEAGEYVDEEGVRWTAKKERPSISLLHHYSCSWKPRNNHFLRYQDVKPKEERRPTVNELANQKGVQQKASGWRLYHIAAQLEEIMDIERDVRLKMQECQNEIAPKHIAKHTIEDDIGMVHEITQGNMQRCKLVTDQLEEAKSAMLKLLEHKPRINEIITKHHSKRPVKKKERS